MDTLIDVLIRLSKDMNYAAKMMIKDAIDEGNILSQIHGTELENAAKKVDEWIENIERENRQ